MLLYSSLGDTNIKWKELQSLSIKAQLWVEAFALRLCRKLLFAIVMAAMCVFLFVRATYELDRRAPRYNDYRGQRERGSERTEKMEDNKKNTVKMKSETQVLRTFMGVGGFGRTCFNKMPGELTLWGDWEFFFFLIYIYIYMHFFSP